MLNEKFYVQVPNMAFSGDREKLNSEELYLYYFLHTIKTALNFSRVLTNIDLVSSQVEFLSKKKERENKARIKKTLLSLRDKGYLSIKAGTEDFGYSDALNIMLTDYDAEYLKANGGYTQVFPYLFDMTNVPDEFMVLCVIRRYSKIDYQIAFTQYADMMCKSEKHVRSLIKDMEDAGMINVDHGIYYVNDNGETRQEKNGYKVNSNYDAPAATDTVEVEIVEGDKETRKHNWYDGKARLTQKDFEILHTTKDKELKDNATRRVHAIKAGKGKNAIEKMENNAVVAIRKREIKKHEAEHVVPNIPVSKFSDEDSDEEISDYARSKAEREKEEKFTSMLDDNKNKDKNDLSWVNDLD